MSFFGFKKAAFPDTSSPEQVQKRVAEIVRPYLTDRFRIFYDPAFPNKDGSKTSIFQISFAVGPGTDSETQKIVHQRFEQLLPILAPLREVQKSYLRLRARRHVPSKSTPDHPLMFIECTWGNSELAHMLENNNFAAWHSHCVQYINRFDLKDPLAKGYTLSKAQTKEHQDILILKSDW